MITESSTIICFLGLIVRPRCVQRVSIESIMYNYCKGEGGTLQMKQCQKEEKSQG